jgi:hypothetical protein
MKYILPGIIIDLIIWMLIYLGFVLGDQTAYVLVACWVGLVFVLSVLMCLTYNIIGSNKDYVYVTGWKRTFKSWYGIISTSLEATVMLLFGSNVLAATYLLSLVLSQIGAKRAEEVHLYLKGKS